MSSFFFEGGGGDGISVGSLQAAAGLRLEVRREGGSPLQASLSGPRPIIVPPSVVNGGGRDPDQITHQKAHEAKSGVSRVSVRACARGRGGEDNCTPARSSCASSCQEVGSLTMRVTRVTLACEAWKVVTGGGGVINGAIVAPGVYFLAPIQTLRKWICERSQLKECTVAAAVAAAARASVHTESYKNWVTAEAQGKI